MNTERSDVSVSAGDRPMLAGLTADIMARVRPGDVLIVVPPFASLHMPSLAAHLLQACGHAAGFGVSVLYANVMWTSLIGRSTARAINVGMSDGELLGERVFAAAAYDLPSLGGTAHRRSLQDGGAKFYRRAAEITWPELEPLAARASEWAAAVAAAIATAGFRIVGFTSAYQQTASSVAIARRLKALRPDIVTIIGGSNCEGAMAGGLASFADCIDFIFSGESETTFPEFVKRVGAGALPPERVIPGEPCHDLDRLPAPTYEEFFEQLQRCFPDASAEAVWIPYESSRGCWWGQKHHCTFCGLNGLGMTFREKSADRVVEDLAVLLRAHTSKRVSMADNIMPYSYFGTLIPRLAAEAPGAHIFYEQKANLSLDKVLALKRAGVAEIQPGIEALSSSLLRRMRKGVSAAQNITLLRYARSAGLDRVAWNILYGFPGDELIEYEETLMLLPLLRHLPPPTAVSQLSIDRFSPYFEQPEQWGLRSLQPLPAYADVLPPDADVVGTAYHFHADYESASLAHPEVIEAIKRECDAWWRAWYGRDADVPLLHVHQLSDRAFVLRDTRGLPGTEEVRLLTREETAWALVPRRFSPAAELESRIAERLAVEVDGSYVPLATADPRLLLALEGEHRQPRTIELVPA
jgi:ribosomal peptide maturation radical SAM protein 1